MPILPYTVPEYVGLITSEHAQRPRFVDTVSLSVSIQAQLQDVLANMPVDYDVDTATGLQLDAVGLWVGISRYLRLPLEGVYFTWDSLNLEEGWNAGNWIAPYDPVSGLTVLSDTDYRFLIRGKIASNSWDGSIPGAYAAWAEVFPGAQIVIQDNQDMSMEVGIANATLSSVQIALIRGGYINLKPEGVRITYYAIPPGGGSLFAWDCDTAALQGWNIGEWVVEAPPTLSL